MTLLIVLRSSVGPEDDRHPLLGELDDGARVVAILGRPEGRPPPV
ncbi:hypothetical protein [Streptomyces sp. MNU77]|nr:hypothetical protein [Streptomyces sp. MNU77]